MYYVSIFFVFLFISIKFFVIVHTNKVAANKNISAWNDYLRRCENKQIDVHLQNLPVLFADEDDSNNSGIIEIFLPDTDDKLYMCFPESSNEYRNIYHLAHTTCRQLGFMTFTEVKGKELPYLVNNESYYGVKSNSYECSGHENSLAHCRWNYIDIDACQMVTEVACGACSKAVKGFSGNLTYGFPFGNPYDVTCEWNINVPEKHSILLTLEQFEMLEEISAELPCSIQLPYIEIMYGFQSKVTYKRYCFSNDVKNMTIPFNTVKIRIFTGLHSHHRVITEEKNSGVIINFKAVPMDEELESPLKLVIFSLLGCSFIICTIICRYIEKHKLCNYYISDESAPDKRDVRRTEIVQRCPSMALEEKPIYSNYRSTEKSERNFNTNISSPRFELKQDIRKITSGNEISKSLCPSASGEKYFDSPKETPKWRIAVKSPEKNDPNRLSVSSLGFDPTICSYPVHTNRFSDRDDEKNK